MLRFERELLSSIKAVSEEQIKKEGELLKPLENGEEMLGHQLGPELQRRFVLWVSTRRRFRESKKSYEEETGLKFEQGPHEVSSSSRRIYDHLFRLAQKADFYGNYFWNCVRVEFQLEEENCPLQIKGDWRVVPILPLCEDCERRHPPRPAVAQTQETSRTLLTMRTERTGLLHGLTHVTPVSRFKIPGIPGTRHIKTK